MSQADDDANLEDLREAEEALIKAHQALNRAMLGIGGAAAGKRAREHFIFKVGFAHGKLSRVTERIDRAGERA